MIEPQQEREPVPTLYVLGVLFFPPLFVWYLLAPQYSKPIRIGAAIYAGLLVIAVAIHLCRLFAP